MPGNLEDSSKWRLTTTTGIPYKVVSMEGTLGREDADIAVSVLIEARNLIAFAAFLMPEPTQLGNLEFPTFTSLGGISQIIVQSIRFRSFDDALPIDPFSDDLVAPAGTYFAIIQVDINYESGKNQTSDPFTFLEITANATGRFLHINVPKAKWRCDTSSTVSSNDEVSGFGIDPITNEVDPNAVRVLGAAEPVRDPIPPISTFEPMTEWTIKWNRIRFEYFRDVLIHRLRIIMGRVNSVTVPVLFNATPETLLFVGYSYTQTNTWRDGQINTPPVTLELRVVEKRILWNGVIQGHNDFWRGGGSTPGWCRLLINGTDNVYKSWDYNDLFRI